MKNHVLRPLWVAIGFVALILIVRHFVVPNDFGVHGRNFTYGYYRLGSIDDWRAFPVKYRGKERCAECHADKNEENLASKHRIIQCENCHGPLLGHPGNPETTLPIDRTRALCLRCHAALPYPSKRGELPAIDPAKHNPEAACSDCHNPHNPDL